MVPPPSQTGTPWTVDQPTPSTYTPPRRAATSFCQPDRKTLVPFVTTFFQGKRRKLNIDEAKPAGAPVTPAAPTEEPKLPAAFLIELQRTLRLRLCGQTPLDHGAIRG